MFVALDLPEPARDRLVDWRDAILDGRRDVRPVRPEALHVTLVFLGWQDEAAAPQIADATFAARPEAAAPLLTPAEVRILKLLPTSTYLQMAATLYVSRNTVKTHLRSVYQKLGVASRSEAIERAVDLGLR